MHPAQHGNMIFVPLYDTYLNIESVTITMTKSRGFRAGTRRKLKKKHRDKFTVEKYLQEFKQGDRVIIDIDSSSQKSMPHFRYQGSAGTIAEKRGMGYVVNVRLGNKEMRLSTKPEHINGV